MIKYSCEDDKKYYYLLDYELNTYFDYEDLNELMSYLKEVLPKNHIVIAIPKCCNLRRIPID